MIYRRCLFLVLLSTTLPQLLAAQTGTISGTVRDKDSEELLMGATVRIGEQGTFTDLDGRFELSLPAGSYTLSISYVGFKTHVQEVEVEPGEPREWLIYLEQESTVLKTATITSGKYRQPLGEVTVSLEVLKADLIENTNKTSLEYAIEKVPGVRVIDRQANIRGGSGFSQGAGSRVLLLLNEVPMLQADAGFPNWADMPIEIIDQVEVLKGAASALYGSSAMNGIINMRTSFATQESQTKFSAFHTSYFTPKDEKLKWWSDTTYTPRTLGGSFSHKQRFDKLDLVLGGYYLNEEGYNKNWHLKYGRFSYTSRYRISDRLAVGLNGTVNKGSRSSFFYWGFRDNYYLGAGNSVTDNDRVRYNFDPYVNYFDKTGNRHRLVGRIYRVENKSTGGRSSQIWQYYGEYQFQRRFNRLNLVATAGFVSLFSTTDAELYGDTTFHQRNLAGFLQFDKKFGERLNVSAGFRFEDNVIKNPGFDFPRGSVEPSEENEGKPVMRFGINFQAADYTFLRGSFGQGYRFPTIAEKFIFTDVGGFTVEPNPSLQSETGWSGEIALKQGFKISSFEGFLDMAAFVYNYKNMMEFNIVSSDFSGGAAFRATNIGGTTIKGYEATLAGRGNFFGLPTTVLAGYTYIDPRFDLFDPEFNRIPETQGEINANNSSSDENILKYRSQHLAKVDVETTWRGFSVGMESFYASHMEAIDAIFQLIVPSLREFREEHDKGYTVFNFRTAYKLADRYKLSLILNNAFNLEYAVRPGLLDAPRNLTVRFDVEL
jgi:outer membrane receptor protein involved in Fe transport